MFKKIIGQDIFINLSPKKSNVRNNKFKIHITYIYSIHFYIPLNVIIVYPAFVIKNGGLKRSKRRVQLILPRQFRTSFNFIQRFTKQVDRWCLRDQPRQTL